MPLAFATAYCINNNSGVAADTLGNIEMKVGSQMDSIRFSSIGYCSRTLQVKDIISNPMITLELQIVNLSEVVVTDKYNTYIPFDDAKKSSLSFSGRPGSILLVKILNPDKTDSVLVKIRARIKSMPAGFKIKNDNLFKLRARIFSVGNDNFPEFDLLTDNVEVELQGKEKFIVADVSKYEIKMPSSGVFVGFEWVPKKQITIDYDRVITGPNISATKASDRELTLMGSISGKWEYFTMEDAPFFMSKKPQNAQIGVDFK